MEMLDNTLGNFVKLTKKRQKDEKSGEVTWIPTYSLKSESVCADYFISAIADEFAYDPVLESWYRWDGFWQKCEGKKEESEFLKIFRAETRTPGEFGYSNNFFRGVLSLAKIDEQVRLPDVPNHYINFLNGVVDITKIGKKGDLVDAEPSNSQKWQIPYNYIPTAWPSFFLRWLDEVLCDAGLVQFIRAFMNCIIKRRVDLQFFVYFYGPEGRNGKGVLTRIIEKLLAEDDIVSTSLLDLKDRFEAMRIYNKGLILLNEQKALNDVTMLKAITGNDLIPARLKNSNESKDFRRSGQVLISSNALMKYNSDDAAPILQRQRIIPFLQNFSEEQQAEFIKKGGENKLQDEIPGIIQWALSMSDDEVTDAIMHRCPAMTAAEEIAAKAGNGLSSFLLDSLVHAPGSRIYIGHGRAWKDRKGVERYGAEGDEKAKLFPAYLAYCRDNRIKTPLSANDFAEAIVSMAKRLWKVRDVARREKPTKFGYPIENIAFSAQFLAEGVEEGKHE